MDLGAPYFQIKDILKKHNVHAFSSNYTLYGDMSHRVMCTLRELTSDVEVYSIDEAFLDITGSTAFRKATIIAIENLMTAGGGFKATYVASSATAGGEQGANLVILQGNINGLPAGAKVNCERSLRSKPVTAGILGPLVEEGEKSTSQRSPYVRVSRGKSRQVSCA